MLEESVHQTVVIVVAVLVVVSCMPVTTNRSSARKPVPSYAPPPQLRRV